MIIVNDVSANRNGTKKGTNRCTPLYYLYVLLYYRNMYKTYVVLYKDGYQKFDSQQWRVAY